MAIYSEGLHRFVELIETIADNKYVLGDQLAKVGISAPNIESSVAAIALAQGELGHARLLYYWILDLLGRQDNKTEITGQNGKAFQKVKEIDNWISLMAGLAVVNLTCRVIFQALLQADNKEVSSRISKMINEQEEHILFAKGWISLLLQDKGRVPKKMEEALAEVSAEAESWLAVIAGQEAPVKEGWLPKGLSLKEEFTEQMKKLTALGEQIHV
jgi:1,2-phenylacetyl-CoA epoxidase catalytic subunit